MRTIRHAVIGVLITLALALTTNGQSPETQAAIKKKIQELYGEQAPSEITFVSRRGLARETTTMKSSGGEKAATTADLVVGDPLAKSSTQASAEGDIARGVIIDEKSGELFLDSDPCSGKIMTFIKGYRKTKVGTVKCGGKEHDRYEIRQGKIEPR